MLKLIRSIFQPQSADAQTVRKIPFAEHQISKQRISNAALRVIEQLQKRGYLGYLVGGGVRDLLLGGTPKDFDVATDATPEQVRDLFRSSRIIGRRFRIVHVRFGREIIEVTTFRGNHDNANAKKNHQSSKSDKGMLLRDNVYGDIRSDALRRDFTVNALYYDPKTETILDYTHGIEDLQRRQLCIIGDADQRYKEDPVRMLRAVRFACKLGFSLDHATDKNIHEHSEYLADIPSARRFDEVLKLFLSGSALATVNMLYDFKLLRHLFPGTADCLDKAYNAVDNELIFQAATNTDKRIRQGKSITPAFIYAAFLWPPLQQAMRTLMAEQQLSPQDAMYQAAQGVIGQQLAVTSIPKRFLIPMREIWTLQLRLEKRSGNRAQQLLEHPRFRAAYDFMLIREQSGENLSGLGDWWTRFQRADDTERGQLLKQTASKNPRRRRRRSPRKPRPESGTTSTSQE